MMTTIKVYAFYAVKVQIQIPPENLKQGGAPGKPVPNPHLLMTNMNKA